MQRRSAEEVANDMRRKIAANAHPCMSTEQFVAAAVDVMVREVADAIAAMEQRS